MNRLMYTSSFKKDLQLMEKRHYPMQEMKCILEILRKDTPIPAKYKDHQLKGCKKHFRELPLCPDWRLLCSKNKNELILTLSRTGTHSDLLE